MKAKQFKSITEILEKKYKKKFYLFQDFQDVLNKVKTVTISHMGTKKQIK
jgi:hypothetical protein